MIEIKRSHLVAATVAPVAVILVTAALVASRGRPSAPGVPVAEEATVPETPIKLRDKSRASKPAAPDETKLLAVSADGFDRINTSLDELGAGYRYEIIDDDVLLDLARLKRFEAVFLACADVGEPQENLPKVLRDYVTGGGTLYASDLRYDLMALAFPEFKDDASVAQGVPQDVRGEVTSPELRDLLGPEIAIKFKSERWRTAAFRGDEVSVLLKGQLKTTAGVPIEAPLAVRFAAGKGAVIFTSFHSEGRVSDVESKLMKFLALKAVTSAAEVRLTEALADAGSLVRVGALAALEAGADPAYHDFQLGNRGPLRFRLEPARPDAMLRLEVVDPDGKATIKRGGSTLAIDVTEAAPGRWQFRATAESVPYSSFPAVVAMGTPSDASDAVSAKSNPAIVEANNVRFDIIDLGNKNVATEVRPLRIAVTKPKFDDMGRLLGALGDGYRYTEIDEHELIKPFALDPYDVLFLTCDGYPAEWATLSDREMRPGVVYGEMKPAIAGKLNRCFDRFVERGGTIYASDLRYALLTYAFRDRAPASDLDLKRLPDVEAAEKNWLKVVTPAAEVGTVAHTLTTLTLSEKLLARRDELTAVIHMSDLVKTEGKPGDIDDLKTVQSGINAFGLPATDADAVAIAEAFGRRRALIIQAYRARNPSKVNKMRREIISADSILKELRDRLLINYGGASRQIIDAQVVDPGLQESIGGTIRLRFPDSAWSPGRFSGDDVQVLIRGTFVSVDRVQLEAPLLVKFRRGRGTIIYTAFHNEAQNSQQELQLLRYLVFSAVTAKEEAVAQQTMLSGGFSPVRQGQVSHATGLDSITKKYQSESGDPLRFSLNFGGGGATLRLTLVAPGGQKYEKETDATLLVEATGAPAGEWLYTVTAVKVPYANFAYSVSIGKGAAAPAKPSR